MIVRIGIAAAAIAGVLALAGAIPLARFTEETIVVELHGDRIRVDGTYVYENPLPIPIRQGMTVPMPPGIEPSIVALFRDGRPIPLPRIFGSHRFELPLRPFEKATVQLRYEQYTPTKSACYLLTTTKGWHRPIGRGTYVIVANEHHVLSSNYRLTSANTFERRQFMPAEDWRFAWR